MKKVDELGINPNPWIDAGFLEGRSIKDKNGFFFIDDNGCIDNPANRRLIRAAPDMYDALLYVFENCSLEGPKCLEAMDKVLKALRLAGGDDA